TRPLLRSRLANPFTYFNLICAILRIPLVLFSRRCPAFGIARLAYNDVNTAVPAHFDMGNFQSSAARSFDGSHYIRLFERAWTFAHDTTHRFVLGAGRERAPTAPTPSRRCFVSKRSAGSRSDNRAAAATRPRWRHRGRWCRARRRNGQRTHPRPGHLG